MGFFATFLPLVANQILLRRLYQEVGQGEVLFFKAVFFLLKKPFFCFGLFVFLR